jgi:hypothetical protein
MVEVNFGVPTNHKGIKDRLDRLNNQFAINEPMVKFSKNPIVDKPKYTSTYHYLAGYPFIYNGNEVDYSGGSSTLFTKTKSSIINLVAGGVSHMGADSSVAPKQYRYNNGILGHGASGSMVIDRLGEIVGIY